MDWYPTFCALAGAEPTDDPPVPPAAVDPAQPHKSIYGTKSFPKLDGTDVWPMLLAPTEHNISSAHEYLVLSKEVVISEKFKLLVAQNYGWEHGTKRFPDNGWKSAEGKWTKPTKPMPCMATDLAGGLNGSLPGVPGQLPCLFDIDADPEERTDLGGIAANAPLLHKLWAELNHTVLTAFCKNVPVKATMKPGSGCLSTPKELLGSCNAACANSYWAKHFGSGSTGPICGVPGC